MYYFLSQKVTSLYARFNASVLLLVIITVFSGPALAADDTKQASNSIPKLLVLGDSLSAAYGIQIEEGWVYQLQEKLGDRYRVVNASISGETTDGGLRSLPGLLENHHPEIVIIELGANDGLRGFPIQVIENNLKRLVQLSKSANAKVLLLGIHIPPNYGKAYTSAFHALYNEISTEYDTALVPFFLDGVATNPELMQDDGLHPKANAQGTILEAVWGGLETLL